MLLFTILNLQATIFSNRRADADTANAGQSKTVAASHDDSSSFNSAISWIEKETAIGLDNDNDNAVREEAATAGQSTTTTAKSQSPTEMIDTSSNLFESESNPRQIQLLSHILVMITYWYTPQQKEQRFLGHTLGTIREWHLHPAIGNITTVIITNNATGTKESIGNTNSDWVTIHQVTFDHPLHMPYYHREVIADYIDRQKNTTNMTELPDSYKELPPPTSYAFFEADTVVNGMGLLAWAQDTALLEEQGVANTYVRHFWRYEWREKLQCVAFTGQTKPIPRNSSNVLSIGGKQFVSLTGGRWAGMYVLTHEHMVNFYNSGSFWTLSLPSSGKSTNAREIQLYGVIHGDGSGKPANKKVGDNTIVPVDVRAGTVDVIAGVHHQSDKYVWKPWPFSKLCVRDLFS